MISQPMNGLTDEQILETKKKATEYLENSSYEVISKVRKKRQQIQSIMFLWLIFPENGRV